MASTNPLAPKADQESEGSFQNTADMTAFVQNLLVQMIYTTLPLQAERMFLYLGLGLHMSNFSMVSKLALSFYVTGREFSRPCLLGSTKSGIFIPTRTHTTTHASALTPR
ncbi:unnamed protein product, partial [Musa acuminata var. zebrina]